MLQSRKSQSSKDLCNNYFKKKKSQKNKNQKILEDTKLEFMISCGRHTEGNVERICH